MACFDAEMTEVNQDTDPKMEEVNLHEDAKMSEVNLDTDAKMAEVNLDTDAKMAEVNLDTVKIRNGYALVIVNKDFEHHDQRVGAQQDKNNIVEFCERAKFTINELKALNIESDDDVTYDSKGRLKTHNLTAKQMKGLFKTISKGDFSTFDAFVCFISSHGDKGGILGTDGEPIPLTQIVDYVKASPENPSLVGKPKLFFTQNCRGSQECKGIKEPDSDGVSADVADSKCGPITIPKEADVLIAYSSVDGYESYRNTEKGSWFITELMKVFNQYADHMDLTDMLTIVNSEVAKKKSKEGNKQMPCFLTTLRKAVYFDVAQPSESYSSPLQEPPNNQPALRRSNCKGLLAPVSSSLEPRDDQLASQL